jgi:hypothetical protein
VTVELGDAATDGLVGVDSTPGSCESPVHATTRAVANTTTLNTAFLAVNLRSIPGFA